VFTRCPASLFHRLQLQSKACILTRVITLFATVTLAAWVMVRYSWDYRMPVCIMVLLAAPAIAVPAVLTGKFVSALLFASVLGLFTPFPTQLSCVRALDMGTTALVAASPIMFGKSADPLMLKHLAGKV
jgi:hypothetical protein